MATNSATTNLYDDYSVFANDSTDNLNLDDDLEDDWYTYQIYSDIIAIGISSTALVGGTISWILLTKWRSFKNYVFLNTLLAILLVNVSQLCIWTIIQDMDDTIFKRIYVFILISYEMPILIYNIWLVIVCVLIYSDIVKVYKNTITHRYLKCAVLGWVVPVSLSITIIITSLLLAGVENFIDQVAVIGFYVLTMVNLFLYLRVVWCLLRTPNVRRSSTSSRWTKFQVLTLSLLMSNVASLPAYFGSLQQSPSWVTVIIDNVTFIPCSAAFVYLYISKSNRMVWYQYYIKNIKSNVNNTMDTV